jgi:hypothetical protein
MAGHQQKCLQTFEIKDVQERVVRLLEREGLLDVDGADPWSSDPPRSPLATRGGHPAGGAAPPSFGKLNA